MCIKFLQKMMFKAVCLFISVLVGSIALPLNEEANLSLFYDRPASFPRIVGGTVAGPVPHMVSMTIGILTRTHTCGGSLVTERHVLTAAHCISHLYVNGALLRSLRAVVGTNRWSTGGTSYRFSHNITHPDFDRDLLKNDLGLMVTSSAVALNANVQTVALNFDFIGGAKAAIVNGWGRFNTTTNDMSPELMELRPYTIDGKQCVEDVAHKVEELEVKIPIVVDPNIEICVFLNDEVGGCHGDSGSPLLLEENREQIGIVSWGLSCAVGAPDIYVRISAYHSWIQQNLR